MTEAENKLFSLTTDDFTQLNNFLEDFQQAMFYSDFDQVAKLEEKFEKYTLAEKLVIVAQIKLISFDEPYPFSFSEDERTVFKFNPFKSKLVGPANTLRDKFLDVIKIIPESFPNVKSVKELALFLACESGEADIIKNFLEFYDNEEKKTTAISKARQIAVMKKTSLVNNIITAKVRDSEKLAALTLVLGFYPPASISEELLEPNTWHVVNPRTNPQTFLYLFKFLSTEQKINLLNFKESGDDRLLIYIYLTTNPTEQLERLKFIANMLTDTEKKFFMTIIESVMNSVQFIRLNLIAEIFQLLSHTQQEEVIKILLNKPTNVFLAPENEENKKEFIFHTVLKMYQTFLEGKPKSVTAAVSLFRITRAEKKAVVDHLLKNEPIKCPKQKAATKDGNLLNQILDHFKDFYDSKLLEGESSHEDNPSEFLNFN